MINKMKRIFFTFLLVLFPFFCLAESNISIPDTSKVEHFANKVIYPEWIKNSVLKTSFLSFAIAHQGLRGANEGYDWGKLHGNTYIVNNSNSHFFETLESVSALGHGYLLYATIHNTNQSFFRKAKTIIGVELIAAVGFEMMYKQVRYNNAFDYSKEHNQNAMVYFTFKEGKIVDSYLSLGPVSGPLVHGSIIGLGTILLIDKIELKNIYNFILRK
jgi:hypothetical protein